VLLIATANVATLSLLRADRLRGEVAVSRALGASRAAVARRFIVESCILALLGGLVAIPIIVLAVSTKLGFTASQIPRLYDVAVTPGLIASLVGAALVIGLVLGVTCTVRARSGDAAQALRGVTRGGGAGWRRFQR